MTDTLYTLLTKLAFDAPDTRDVLVPFLKSAMVFPSKNALEKYLAAHPAADRSRHSVKNQNSSNPPPKAQRKPRKVRHFKLPESRFDKKTILFGVHGLNPLGLSDEIPFYHKKFKVGDLLDIAGLSSVGSVEECQIYIDAKSMTIRSMKKTEDVRFFLRKLLKDENGNIYLHNDCLFLGTKAPKGLGTRIFANQVAKARDMGFDRITCDAYRNDQEDPEYGKGVGYKVWPKMGYDGDVPENIEEKIPQEFLDRFKSAGLVGPTPRVRWFYEVAGGEEWWAKNGGGFDAVFDLKEGSNSLKVHDAYIAKKAAEAGQTTEEYMSKTATEKKVPEKKGDNVTLTPEDHQILDGYYKPIIAENERKYQESLAANKTKK